MRAYHDWLLPGLRRSKEACCVAVILLATLVLPKSSVTGAGFFCPRDSDAQCWIVYTDSCTTTTQQSAFGGCLELADRSCSRTRMSLSSLRISRIQPLKSCPAMTDIDLENNMVDSLFDHIALTDGMTGLRTLNLARNKFTELKQEWFADTGMLRLLNVSWNQISVMEATTFSSLGLLEILDLSNNRLSGELSSTLFKGLSNLVSVSLAHNMIRELPADVFIGLDRLAFINLHSNRIATVWSESFAAFMTRTSSKLHLSSNNITSLDAAMIGSGRIHIAGNPFRCDFAACPLVASKRQEIVDLAEVRCAQPDTVQGFRMKDVFELLGCGSGAASTCVPHECESRLHPDHATCSGDASPAAPAAAAAARCACNGPLYASSGLQCVCGAGARLVNLGLCSGEYGVKCLLNYTCLDRDECAERSPCGDGGGDGGTRCSNTIGSYVCHDARMAVTTTAGQEVRVASDCAPACVHGAECVRRDGGAPRCECAFGFARVATGNCTSLRRPGGAGTSPSHPDGDGGGGDGARDGNSKLVLIIAVVGGVAGMLALLYVAFHTVRKCRRRRRSKKGALVRQVSDRSSAGFMQPNTDYEPSMDRCVLQKGTNRTGVNPIYASAEKSDKKAKSALSILYESGRHGYARPQNVLVQTTQHNIVSVPVDGAHRGLPPPISMSQDGPSSPALPQPGPKPGSRHPYVVLNAINGEMLTSLTPPCHVTANHSHMYHSPRDSLLTTTSSVSESDLDNLALHRDDYNPEMEPGGRKPVALIRPYDQASITPLGTGTLLLGSAISNKQGSLVVSAADHTLGCEKETGLSLISEEATVKYQPPSDVGAATVQVVSTIQKRPGSAGASSVDS